MTAATLDDVLESIANAPDGPSVGAFFDYDGTLLCGYSALLIAADHLRRREIMPHQMVRDAVRSASAIRDHDGAAMVTTGAETLQGRRHRALLDLADRDFSSVLARRLYSEGMRLIAAHQAKGHTVVIATSATSYQVEPAAEALGVEHVLCTRPEVVDGVLTGRIDGDVLWGPGKADAIARFADEHDVALSKSFAYSDGEEDVAMLQLMAHPHAVNGGRALNEVADTNGWRRLECASQARATPLDRVRSWLGLSSFTPVMTAAAAVGLTRSDLGATSDVVTAVWPRLALGIGGVDVRVDGAEHLHGHRPAVVVFNHHTLLDELVIGDLLRRDYVMVLHDHHTIERVVSAIGKRLGSVVSEDGTGDTTASITAALSEGRTVAIAVPEHPRRSVDIAGNGARALRLAAANGVPVIPVHVLDAADLQRSLGSFKSGVVNVRVAPPIEVEALATDHPAARRRLAAAFDSFY